MKTGIVFFDTIEQSKIGTVRGLISFPFTLVFTLILNILILNTNKVFKFKDIRSKKLLIKFFTVSVLMAVILVSLLGVQNETRTKESVVYGASVFFAIYGMMLLNVLLGHKVNIKGIIGILGLATLFGALDSFILLKLGPHFN